MRVKEMIERLSLEVVAGGDNLDKDITWAYASDLLSDVMGNSKEGNVWITMQTHLNVVAVASLKDLAAIIMVTGNRPAADVLTRAEEEGVVILCTADSSFDTAGRLYRLLTE
jgi:serine kinase of HPr protein (carbohydrate metabolism regulator)